MHNRFDGANLNNRQSPVEVLHGHTECNGYATG